MSNLGDFVVVWLIGLFSYPAIYWLFCKWYDRPRPFNISKDFRDTCGRDCAIK